jgi:hypothetical protein
MLLAGVLINAFESQARFALKRLPGPEARRRHHTERLELLKIIRRKPLPDSAASDIVSYVRNHPDASVRAHYNLACFYARLSAHPDRGDQPNVASSPTRRCETLALTELDSALADGSLLSWAIADPSLTPLQLATPQAWAALIARHTPSPHGVDTAPVPSDPSPVVREEMLEAYEDWLVGNGVDVHEVRSRADGGVEMVTSTGFIVVWVHVDSARPVRSDTIRSARRASGGDAQVVVLASVDATTTVAAAALARRTSVRILRITADGTVLQLGS